jgi:hypothetical protein
MVSGSIDQNNIPKAPEPAPIREMITSNSTKLCIGYIKNKKRNSKVSEEEINQVFLLPISFESHHQKGMLANATIPFVNNTVPWYSCRFKAYLV